MSTLTENDLYYLNSIKRTLDRLHTAINEKVAETGVYGLANDAMNDDLDWLDCFIEKHEREIRAKTT